MLPNAHIVAFVMEQTGIDQESAEEIVEATFDRTLWMVDLKCLVPESYSCSCCHAYDYKIIGPLGTLLTSVIETK